MLFQNSPYYISKLWLHKLKHFGEPGAIDQSSFLCAHNFVQPHLWSHVDSLALACSPDTWSYLVEQFGVRYPTCHARGCQTRLYPCVECQRLHEAVHQRRVREMTEFIRLRDKWNLEQQQNAITQSRVFAISKVWFNQWDQFVQMPNSALVLDVPGKIDNFSICLKPATPVVAATPSMPKKKKTKQSLRQSSNVQYQFNTSKRFFLIFL